MQKDNYINGMHKETYKQLFNNELDQVVSDDEVNDVENARVLDTIDFYSIYQDKIIFKELIKKYYKIKGIDFNKISYNPYSEEYEYRDSSNNIFITFDMLSDEVDDISKKELLSKKRYHMCHVKSIMGALKIKDSKVLTGYVHMDKFKYLHSILEHNKDGIDYIIDWTRNIEMPKSDYFKLTKFDVVSILDSFEIKKDLKIFEKIFDYKPDNNKQLGKYKIYATFGNEIMKNLEKNSHILK